MPCAKLDFTQRGDLMASGISVRQKGDFSRTKKYLTKKLNVLDMVTLRWYGQKGVNALKKATPVDSGLTRDSWRYVIEKDERGTSIIWCNDNYAGNGERYTVPVAVLIDNGHATKDGKWVPGAHFIDAALDPIISEIADRLVKGDD